MPGWIRPSVARRSFSTLLLAVVLASASVRIILRRPAHVHNDPPFEVLLDWDDIGLASGPVVPGTLAESDPDSIFLALQLELDCDPELEECDPEPEPEPASTHRARAQPLGEHTRTPDGLLVVNPNGSHPIFELIRDAETAWEAKCARASKTLDEAVAEYRRRYRRAPPLGFDKWWDYVVKHDVQLPDEYDEIFHDLEPFWGMDPVELAISQQELEVLPNLVTVQKMEGHPRFRIARSTLSHGSQEIHTVEDILALVHEVEHDLPPMRITLSPFDVPTKLSDWRIMSMAREAAANGTTLTRAELPPITEVGWIQACPPDSPARLHPPLLPSRLTTPAYVPSSPKTFIADHRVAMDPCMNPSILATHGQFISHHQGPYPQPTFIPQFSLCSTLLHHDIRPPVPYQWAYDVDLDSGAFEGDVPWEDKVDERLSWRGRTTGIFASPDTLWVHGHRARLVTFTNALEGNLSLLHVPQGDEEWSPVGEPESVRRASVNPAWMDVAFADNPIACDQERGTCDEMERLWEFRRMQARGEEGRYKFILDVDGNGWSGRFKRLITSNALIFKASVYPEWYMSRIAPWVHYVPVQVSYVDLYDTVAFFRAQDALAERIAKAGRDWSRRFWRRQDMTAYLYRLLLEWARVTSLDRASMSHGHVE